MTEYQYDPEAYCDECGATGAYIVPRQPGYSDLLCADCLAEEAEGEMIDVYEEV